MSRNKLIYCLADHAIVVHSGRDGGTWNGALENLKKQWVSLWVKHSEDKRAGNDQLVSLGGQWLPEDILDQEAVNLTPYSSSEETLNAAGKLPANDAATLSGQNKKDINSVTAEAVDSDSKGSLYEFFCGKLKVILAEGPMKQKEMEARLGLTPAQMNAWLKQAQTDGIIKKKLKPVRYELLEQTGLHQISLF